MSSKGRSPLAVKGLCRLEIQWKTESLLPSFHALRTPWLLTPYAQRKHTEQIPDKRVGGWGGSAGGSEGGSGGGLRQDTQELKGLRNPEREHLYKLWDGWPWGEVSWTNSKTCVCQGAGKDTFKKEEKPPNYCPFTYVLAFVQLKKKPEYTAMPIVFAFLGSLCVNHTLKSLYDEFYSSFIIESTTTISPIYCHLCQEYWSGLPLYSQGIVPTQGSNPSLAYCRQILYHLNCQESPYSLTTALDQIDLPVGWSPASSWVMLTAC